MSATILLADADAQSRMEWEIRLQDQGYAVISVESGQALLDCCLRLRPDLVLINAQMPDIPGPEIYRRLKAGTQNKLTPVISIDSFTLPPSGVSADVLWTSNSSQGEMLNRMDSLLHLKSYIDEQSVSVITSLARSIEGRDPYTKGHCDRLSTLTVQFGSRLDLCARDLEALKIAASIHDIGKVIVPDSILFKPGWLTIEEIKVMEQHSIEGERICSPMNSLRDVLPIIRHHHERMDGSGYPDGLRRSLIPFAARVLQVVDIFDALTTDRAYRKSVTVARALTILSEEARRGWLDPQLINQFATFVAAKPASCAAPSFAKAHSVQFG